MALRARVLAHIRAHPDGPAVVTPVSFAELGFAAASTQAAVEGVRSRLRERLADLDAVDRLALVDAPSGELFRVPVEVRPTKADEPIGVELGVVVVSKPIRDRPNWVAYVPVVPGLELVSSRDSGVALAERAAAKAVAVMRKWRQPSAVLAAAEPHDSRLDVLEVELPEGGGDAAGDAQADSMLAELGVDLTARAGGRIDQREDLVGQVLETLAAEGRSSAMLVGPPGVGKSVLVDEVARRVALGEAPDRLTGRRLWRLSANELIAGALYTGQWAGARPPLDLRSSTRQGDRCDGGPGRDRGRRQMVEERQQSLARASTLPRRRRDHDRLRVHA